MSAGMDHSAPFGGRDGSYFLSSSRINLGDVILNGIDFDIEIGDSLSSGMI